VQLRGHHLLEPGIDPEVLDDPGKKEAYHARIYENVSSITLYKRCPGRGVVTGTVLSHLRLTIVNYYRRGGGFYFHNTAGLVRSPSSTGEHLGGLD